jgi:hypothetical protein
VRKVLLHLLLGADQPADQDEADVVAGPVEFIDHLGAVLAVRQVELRVAVVVRADPQLAEVEVRPDDPRPAGARRTDPAARRSAGSRP